MYYVPTPRHPTPPERGRPPPNETELVYRSRTRLADGVRYTMRSMVTLVRSGFSGRMRQYLNEMA